MNRDSTMVFSNKIFPRINIYLCFIFWIIVFPLTHFAVFLDESILGSSVNLYGIITICLVVANCLWYLNRNLVLHKAEVIRNMSIATALLSLPLLLHISEIGFCIPLVLPFLITAVVLFSLHQIRYSIQKRNLLLWIIVAGNTINAIIHDASFVIQYNIDTPPADGILASISITICMYLLLRSRFSAFDIIGNLFTLIILYLYFLHHINIKVIFITVPSVMILLGLLLKENLKTGLTIIAITTICTWMSYCLGFFDNFDPVSEISKYASDTMAHIKTAWNNILLGHGLGTFAMANLEVNPNYYTERAYSTILHLMAIGGITAVIPMLMAWYALIKTSLNKINSLSRRLSNLSILLPFILATVTTSISVFSIPVFFAMCYTIWYVSCQNPISKKNVTWKQLYIRRVPIAIITSVSLLFFITGIISLNQISKIEKENICDNLQNRVVNPFIVASRLREHEMRCVYQGLTVFPVAQWLASYRQIMMNEIIPYRPKKIFFEHLINLEDHFTEEEKREVRDLSDRLYPTLLPEMEENDKINEITSERDKDRKESSATEDSKSEDESPDMKKMTYRPEEMSRSR